MRKQVTNKALMEDSAIAAAIDAGDSPEDAARKFGVSPNAKFPCCICHIAKADIALPRTAKTLNESANAEKRKKASAEADAYPLKP
jgi:transposase-like protein